MWRANILASFQKITHSNIFGFLFGITCIFSSIGIVNISPLDISINIANANSTTYYIDNTTWSNSNTGTSQVSPWKTVEKVNSTTLSPGDSILFKCGEKWNEVLRIKNSGTLGNPITYRSYGNCTLGNKPEITGAMTLTGVWSVYSGNIYSIPLVLTGTNIPTQVFVDGNTMSLARWPNAAFFIPSASTTTELTFTGFSVWNPSDIIGAKAQIWTESYRVEWVAVTGYNTGTTSITHVATSYDTALQGYLENKLVFLDAPGEWFYDSVAQVLYLYSPDGSNPGDHTVEVSKNQYAINEITSSSYIKIDGIKVTKASDINIFMNGTGTSVTIVNTDISHGFNSGIDIRKHTAVDISNNTIEKCANGIRGYDSMGKIKGNLLDNIGMDGEPRSSNAAIATSLYPSGYEITDNTINNIAYIGICFGQNAIINHNILTKTCQRLTDCGAIYTWQWQSTLSGTTKIFTNYFFDNHSVISDNIIRDVGYGVDRNEDGIYLDDLSRSIIVSGNTIENAQNGIFSHNGRYHLISGNTIYKPRKKGIYVAADSIGWPGISHDNTVQNNTILSDSKESFIGMRSTVDDQGWIATLSGNRYIDVFKKSDILVYSWYKGHNDGYITETLGDVDTSGTLFPYFGFNPLSLSGMTFSGNLLKNGDFNTGSSNWSFWSQSGTRSISYNLSGSFNGGSLDFWEGSDPQALLISNTFSLEADAYYAVDFSIRMASGTSRMNTIQSIIRKNGGNYGLYMDQIPMTGVTSTQKHYQYILRSKVTATDARLDTELSSSGLVIEVDNVSVRKILSNVQNTPPANQTLFLINSGSVAKSIPCTLDTTVCTEYVDINNTPITWPVTLQPFSSKMILWRNSPYANPRYVAPVIPPVTPPPVNNWNTNWGWSSNTGSINSNSWSSNTSGETMDSCPTGDASPSRYDGVCVPKQDSTNISTGSSQKTTNSQSFSLRLFITLPAFDGLDLKKPLPNKATSEVNFFAKRVIDLLKSKNLTTKNMDRYYRALTKYFALKAEKLGETKEGRIYTALSKRFSVLYSLWKNQ